MKRFRAILFWTHLTAGVACGIVILVMSFTGVVLAFKPQIQNWIDRDVRYVAVTDASRMAPSALLASVKRVKPDANIQSLAFDRDHDVATTVSLGGREGNLFVNPYTGAILGQASRPTAAFFQSMTSWHRYMGASGESRAAGRAATGASNMAFFFLGLTGLYLWWPKQLVSRYLRPILWFKSTSTGKARDFNWHNTIGFWCLLPILIMTASGVMMSYTWGNNLVYRLTGSPVPVARGGGPGPGGPGPGAQDARAGGARAQEGRGGRGEAPVANQGAALPDERNARAQAGRRPEGARPEDGGPGGFGQGPTVIPESIDLLVARAEQQVPTWTQLSLRLPNRTDGPVSFTLTDGAQWNAFARSQLTLRGATADVVQWQPYEAQNLGQKLRGWLRFAHTGELGGFIGQLIAGLGCLGGVFLVYTGFALAVRRLWHWALWKRISGRSREPVNARTAAGTVSQPLMDEP